MDLKGQRLIRRALTLQGHQLSLPPRAKLESHCLGSQILLWRPDPAVVAEFAESEPHLWQMHTCYLLVDSCLSVRGEKNPLRCGGSNEALRETSCWVLHLQDVFPASAWKPSVFYLPSLAKHSHFEGCSCLWQPKHKAGQKPFLPNKQAVPFQLQERMEASLQSPVSGIKKKMSLHAVWRFHKIHTNQSPSLII